MLFKKIAILCVLIVVIKCDDGNVAHSRTKRVPFLTGSGLGVS